MSHSKPHSKEVRLYYLNRELERVNNAIAHHELRAVIPPANCTDVDLFTHCEMQWAQGYRLRAAQIRDEVLRLEGQLELRLAAS